MLHRRFEGMAYKTGLNWNISLYDLTLVWCSFDLITKIVTHKGFRFRWKIRGGRWEPRLFDYSTSYKVTNNAIPN